MNGGMSILKCFMKRYYSLKKTIDASVRLITHTYMLFAYVITFVYSSHTYMLFEHTCILQLKSPFTLTLYISMLHVALTV